jgi:hypothetical protein
MPRIQAMPVYHAGCRAQARSAMIDRRSIQSSETRTPYDIDQPP